MVMSWKLDARIAHKQKNNFVYLIFKISEKKYHKKYNQNV